MSGAAKIRVTLSRNDVVNLMGALESVIEDYKYDGGLIHAQPEMDLLERLRERLAKHDAGALRGTDR